MKKIFAILMFAATAAYAGTTNWVFMTFGVSTNVAPSPANLP
jgi:hypothetical protein